MSTPTNVLGLIDAISRGSTTVGSVTYIVEYLEKHPEDAVARNALLKVVIKLIAGGTSLGPDYANAVLRLFP